MKAITIGALLLAGASASAQATQFVDNGDFTTLTSGLGQLTTNTTAPSWYVPSGGYTFVFAQADQAVPGQYGSLALWDSANGGGSSWNGLAAGGGNFAALDGDFQNQPLLQTINGLTVGGKYDLSFDYAFGQQTGFNGATVQSLDFGFQGAAMNTGRLQRRQSRLYRLAK